MTREEIVAIRRTAWLEAIRLVASARDNIDLAASPESAVAQFRATALRHLCEAMGADSRA